MGSPFLGEFLGTLVMILLGDGVVAGVLLKRSKAEGGGWMVITTGWAFAVMAGVFTAIACGSKAAYLNPAVTLGFAISSGDYSRVGSNMLAQLLGAFCGAVLVWIHFGPHWKQTPDAPAKLAIFCTAPAIRSAGWNFVSEVIGTLTLVFVVATIFSKGVAAEGPAAGLGPYLVGALVWGIGLSLGGTTGYAINPARDLGPRIAHAVLPIAGKGGSDWGYAPIPIFGPLLGAAVAGVLIRWIQF
ncbi:MAG: MIP/aquaporin family protein [Candidatus Acidiferrales bacterium]